LFVKEKQEWNLFAPGATSRKVTAITSAKPLPFWSPCFQSLGEKPRPKMEIPFCRMEPDVSNGFSPQWKFRFSPPNPIGRMDPCPWNGNSIVASQIPIPQWISIPHIGHPIVQIV
jgi:hypothetical protein